MKLSLPIFLCLFFLLPCPTISDAHELNGHMSLEARVFADSPRYPEQEHHNISIALAPEYFHQWIGGHSFTFIPFLRLDTADTERSHFDIRELDFLLLGDPWELRLGIGRVFWGVTEFVHLIDIINQTDLVEDIKGEDRLGQPMVHLSIPGNWGVFDFFALPFFRERTFPGLEGRLRPAIPVDTDNPIYQSGAEENHFDFALRYSRVLDSGDIGIYYFRGTGRAPMFIPTVNSLGKPVLLPFYQQIDQAGLDLQMVAGNWLWKLEALYQHNDRRSYCAATGGLEYTFFGIGGTMADLGLIVEFAYDDRGSGGATSFENDLFLGVRLGINDGASTEILAGLGHDLDSRGDILQIEASRRLTDRLRIFLDAWAFFNSDPGDYFLYSIRDDDFIRLQLFYYF